MLAGKTRLIESSTTMQGRRYSRFPVHIPSKIAGDSQFPLRAGQTLRIRVDPRKKTVVFTPLYNDRSRMRAS